MALVVPIFPLQAHVLPGGLLTLRIFEPRYLRLVKESLVSGNGFGVCMLQDVDNSDKKHILPIGTQVEIIDFDGLDDGVLGITVRGLHRFKLLSSSVEFDGLRMGNISLLPDWKSQPVADNQTLLIEQLKKIFDAYPALDNLYDDKDYKDVCWVSQRLIELLPFGSSVKQELLSAPDCTYSVNFLLENCQDIELT